MKLSRRKIGLLATAFATLFAGCSGGGGSTGPPPPSLVIVTNNLQDAVNGKAYTQTLGAANGTPPYTWSLAQGSGPLPANLSLDANTGAISGTPSATASFSFTIQVKDSVGATATKSLSIRVADPLAITTGSLPDAAINVPYSQTLQATGGIPPDQWSVSAGALPAGLTLSSSGVISGTPTASGGFDFTPAVSDAENPAQNTSRALHLNIPVPPPIITTSFLPGTTLGADYRAQLAATGGSNNGTGSWTIVAGSLPDGMQFNGAFGNAQILGSPTGAGDFPFTVQLADTGSAGTTTKGLDIKVSGTPIGRNDSIATASPLSNGIYRASVSPYADPPNTANPDNDYYKLTAAPGATVTIQIIANQGLVFDNSASPLDSVIEILDASGSRLTICSQPDSPNGPFNTPCMDDDNLVLFTLDSELFLQVPASNSGPLTFYLHVLDFTGSARPDFVYDLFIQGVN